MVGFRHQHGCMSQYTPIYSVHIPGRSKNSPASEINQRASFRSPCRLHAMTPHSEVS